MPSPKKKLPTGPIRIEQSFSRRADLFNSPILDREPSNSKSLEEEAVILESRKQDSGMTESSSIEFGKIDSAVQEVSQSESTSQPESSIVFPEPILENKKLEFKKQDSSQPENSLTESKKLDSELKPELIESSLTQQYLSPVATPPTIPEIRNQESGKQESYENSIIKLCLQERETSIDISKKLESQKQEFTKQESSFKEIEHKKVAMRLSAEAVACLHSLRMNTGLPYEILVDVMIRNWEHLPAKLQKQYLSEAKQVRIQRLIAGQDKAMQTVRSKLTE